MWVAGSVHTLLQLLAPPVGKSVGWTQPFLGMGLFPAEFTILVGNCKYYQTPATLTCGSGAVARSGMVETYPFMRVSVEAKPALYWPWLLKQSDVKWLAYTHKLRWTAAGTLSLKMKCNHCLFCCSVAGTEYRHLCWFTQPTTEQLYV